MSRLRIITATLVALLVLAVLAIDGFLGQPVFFNLLVLVLVGLSAREFYALAERRGLRPFKVLGIVVAVLLVASIWWGLAATGTGEVDPAGGSSSGAGPRSAPHELLGALLALAVIPLFIQHFLRPHFQAMIEEVSVTFFGVFYVGFLASFAVRIGFLQPDRAWAYLVLFLAVVKVSDVAAYAIGRAFGRRRLAPEISPNKTVEGLVAALVTGFVLAFFLRLILPVGAYLSWAMAPVFGLLVAGLGQLGDLMESALKRSAETKDSGELLPAYGGALDLVDSLLVAAPGAYLLLELFRQVGT